MTGTESCPSPGAKFTLYPRPRLNPVRSPQPFLAQPSPGLTHSPFTHNPLVKKLHTAELDSGGERNGGEGSFPRARAFWQVPPKPPRGLDLRGPPTTLSGSSLGFCFLLFACSFAHLFMQGRSLTLVVQVGLDRHNPPHPRCLEATIPHQKQLSFVSSCGNCESKVPSSKTLPPPPRASL